MSETKEKYFPGKGCECYAYCECECACGVDWTDPYVYKLEAENKRLREAISEAKGVMQAICNHQKIVAGEPLYKMSATYRMAESGLKALQPEEALRGENG